jgi:hypothetical protein
VLPIILVPQCHLIHRVQVGPGTCFDDIRAGGFTAGRIAAELDFHLDLADGVFAASDRLNLVIDEASGDPRDAIDGLIGRIHGPITDSGVLENHIIPLQSNSSGWDGLITCCGMDIIQRKDIRSG